MWERTILGARNTVGALWLLGWALAVGGETGTITTVAGDGFTDERGYGRFGGDGGPAIDASLNFPSGAFIDDAGVLYIVDTGNHRIRKVDSEGIITTVAGIGFSGFSGDEGPAVRARLSYPTDVFIDRFENIYIADPGNRRIRKVDASGVITTVAGSGRWGFSGDGGPAVFARLNSPTAVFKAASGDLYVADSGNSRVRKVDPAGIISTMAGNGTMAFSGDGNQATHASLFFPNDIWMDDQGNLLISDGDNHRIRKVDQNGSIATVAGYGIDEHRHMHFSGDGGLASNALLSFTAGVFVDRWNNIYISDSSNHRVRRVDRLGIISTIAGDGYKGERGYGRFTRDGIPATEASLSYPRGVSVDRFGHLYVADDANHRIRRIEGIGASELSGGDSRNRHHSP